MASSIQSDSGVQLKTWLCDKHAEPMSVFCKQHNIPICHLCTTKDHIQEQCKLDDIDHVILEMRKKLEDTRTEVEETKKCLAKFDSELDSCLTSAGIHFHSVNGDVNALYEDKLKTVKDKQQDEIRLINEEVDEEIRIINEKRDKQIKACNKKRETRIKACNKEAEKLQQTIAEKQAKLVSETKTMKNVVDRKIENLRSKNQYAIGTMDNMSSKINQISKDDKILVTEAPQVLASLGESLNAYVHQDVSDYLDQIKRETERVKFVEGKVGGEDYGRIDGYIGKWDLVKSVDLPPFLHESQVCDLISDEEICVLSSLVLHVTNLRTGQTETAVERDKLFGTMHVSSCAPIDSNVTVCGKWRIDTGLSGSLYGWITLYDRQWKVVREVAIPENYDSISSYVYVDADRDGMIVAAQDEQSTIYVINPADGKIVNTITMKGKIVCHWLQALPSGDIIVRTGSSEFTVISRLGQRKAVIRCDEWTSGYCRVDKLTGVLYITYFNKERDIYAVDQVTCDGDIQAVRIVEFEKSDRSGPCLVAPSGDLIACDRRRLCVYKKRFSL